MAGTIVTERVAGIPNGWPPELDASVKVRYVAPLLINMSERSADFLKYIGGVEQFTFNSTTVEWMEDDIWNRRLSHSGLAAGTTTTLTVTAAAHRYPIGTILYNVPDGEYARVTGHIDANNIQIARDITADVTEGAWASTDEVLVAGIAMDENDDYVFRPTSIFTLPYNRPQVFQTGVQASFRRLETALYGLRGSDLDKQAADMVAENFVAMEMAAVHGRRFDGTAAVPAMMGGLKFYVTSANGAQVTNLSSAPLTRADIDNDLQDLFYAVGPENTATTLLVDAWAKRKLSSFFAGSERMSSQPSGAAGVVVDKIYTDFGTLDIMLHPAVAKGEMYLFNKDKIQVGHHGSLGRPQLRQLPPSTVGPRSQKVFYADLSMIVGGVQGMARIHGYSTSA
jgi:hypothetical protein